ncbi:MAG: prepilin-type N-terminal cleavage/methylation domain-containing protein, partial [Patescibacteria group bacterium]
MRKFPTYTEQSGVSNKQEVFAQAKTPRKLGFTLTEVMIGIMILTVAVVSGTNLLIGLVQTNQNNLTTLQAYYFAQEGLEAVRNIRDTNWLHNTDWLGENGGLFGGKFEIGKDYSVNIEYRAFDVGSNSTGASNVSELVSPWFVSDENKGEIFKRISKGNTYFGADVADAIPTGFKRVISIKKYNCDEFAGAGICNDSDENNYVLVESKVAWKVGVKDRELVLYEVLTN